MLLEEYKNQNDDMIHMFLVYISKESTLGDLYEYVKENKETYKYPMYFMQLWIESTLLAIQMFYVLLSVLFEISFDFRL